VFTDEADWRMTEPIVNGEFLLTATHQTEGQQIVASVLRPWRNLVSASDIDNSGDDSAADALRIINALFRREFLVAEAEQLVDPSEVGDWPGVYPDQNGDGEMTALDALRVINDLAKSGENEAPIAAALADHVLSRREELEWEESPPQSLDPQKLILVSSSQPYQDNTLREWAVEIDRSDAGAAGLPLDLADRRDALQTMEVTTTNPA